jgi:geranyl-CoA carboxylase alpha subunit
MVAKFIAHGRDRDDAIRRLVRALADAPLMGLRHNGRFLRDLLRHPQPSRAAQHDHHAARRVGRRGRAAAAAPVPPDEAWRWPPRCAPATTRSARPAWPRFELTLQCQGETRTLRAPAG